MEKNKKSTKEIKENKIISLKQFKKNLIIKWVLKKSKSF